MPQSSLFRKTASKVKRLSLLTKTVLMVTISLTILSVVFIFSSYHFYTKNVDQYYKDHAMSVAKTAASLLDGNRIAYYADSEATDEEYDAMLDALFHIKESSDVLYLYAERVNAADKTVTYIMDADTETPTARGTVVALPKENYEFAEHLDREIPAFITHGDYGWLCTACAPVWNDNGEVTALVGVDISMERVVAERSRFLHSCLLIGVIFGLLMIALSLWFMNRMIVAPVDQLAAAASCNINDKRMMNVQSMISQLEIHTGDEIETLAESLKKMETETNLYIKELTTATSEQERIGTELDVAKQIQSSMLPCSFPAFPDRKEFDIYAMMEPAKEVGGDFYDFFMVDDSHLAVVMADVSGKGIPAALFMVVAKTLIRNQAQTGLSPEEVFHKVNLQLCENNDAGMFVTAWLGILDVHTGILSYVNAGHTHPIICQNHEQFEFLQSKAGFVLGGIETIRYTKQELQLGIGDTILLYTDGVTEATNSADELFGESRLHIVANRSNGCTPKELIAAVKADMEDFVKEAPQFDDVTMLALSYFGDSSGTTVSKVFPAKTEQLESVIEWLTEQLESSQCPMKYSTQIQIAVEEIFVNVANYAYPDAEGDVTISMDFNQAQSVVSIKVSDHGIPYNPLEHGEPDITLPPEQRNIGGLGIHMVRKTMDDVQYCRSENQNNLTIFKKW